MYNMARARACVRTSVTHKQLRIAEPPNMEDEVDEDEDEDEDVKGLTTHGPADGDAGDSAAAVCVR